MGPLPPAESPNRRRYRLSGKGHEPEIVKFRRSKIVGPPEAGILYLKGLEYLLTGFPGPKGKGMGELLAFQNALQNYLTGL